MLRTALALPCRVLASTTAVRRAVLAGVFAAGIVLCGWVLSDRAQATETVPNVPTTGQPVAGDAVTQSVTGMPVPAKPVPAKPVPAKPVPAKPGSARPVADPARLPKNVSAVAASVVRTATQEPRRADGDGREIADALDGLDRLGDLGDLGDLAGNTVVLVPPSTGSLVGDLPDLPDLRPTRKAPDGTRTDAGTVPAAAHADDPGASSGVPAVPGAEIPGPRISDIITLPRTAPENLTRPAFAAQPSFSARMFVTIAPVEGPRAPAPTHSATSSPDDAVAGSVHRADAPSALCTASAPAAPAALARVSGAHSPNAGPHERPGDVPVSPA